MDVLNFTEFRKDLKNAMDKVGNGEDVIIVSRSKNKNVVLISLKEYNSMKETMYLLSSRKNMKRLEESINEMHRGKHESHALVDK